MLKNSVKDMVQRLLYILMNTQIQEVVGLNMALMQLKDMIVIFTYSYLMKRAIYKCQKLELNGEI